MQNLVKDRRIGYWLDSLAGLQFLERAGLFSSQKYLRLNMENTKPHIQRVLRTARVRT
jgi:hypothetical protein